MNPGSKHQLSFCHLSPFESAWVPPGHSRFYGVWLANCYFASLSRRKMPSGPKGNNYIHPLLQLNCRKPPLPFRCVITTTAAMSKHCQIRVTRRRLDGN